MSHHFSAANLKSPDDDARLDVTDLFVFTAPDDPDRTVLIMNSNPFAKGSEFHPDAVYRFSIDNDVDAVADVAFSFTFSEPKNGQQTAAAHYATGDDARTRESRGEVLIEAAPVSFDSAGMPVQAGLCRLFIGKRSDPFFADAEGVLHWLAAGEPGIFDWAGADVFGEANIYNTESATPVGIAVLSVVIALAVSWGATYGGSLVFDYGFHVETAGDSPVWQPSDVNVLPGEH
jgi:hypothetical protein